MCECLSEESESNSDTDTTPSKSEMAKSTNEGLNK